MYIVSLQDREGCSMLYLLLKRNNKIASHFTSKMGLFRNSKEMQFRTCSLWKPQGSLENKGEGHSVIKEKGGVGMGLL